jgi:hypothetical protein
MAGKWTGSFSFKTGVVRRKDIGYVVLLSDEMLAEKVPHAEFAVWNAGKWFDCGRADWRPAGACVIRKPIEQLVAVGEFGGVRVVGSGDDHEEQIGNKESDPEDRGPLRCARTIGTRVYAVGMDRQAYRRDGLNAWSAIDQGARPPADSEEVVGFESVDGFSEKELYAVGWDGEIWQYDGKKWKQIDSPTNLILTDVCCGDELAYACGRQGLLLEGRGSKWRVIKQDAIDDDIWGLAWYKGELYLSTMGAVYVLRDGAIEDVEMGDDEPETCYTLSAADGVLWSTGAKDIMAFDGKKWTRID